MHRALHVNKNHSFLTQHSVNRERKEIESEMVAKKYKLCRNLFAPSNWCEEQDLHSPPVRRCEKSLKVLDTVR